MIRLDKPHYRFRLIQEELQQEDNLLSVGRLCDLACVSRSGYYRWVSAADSRAQREEQDRRDFELILEAYRFRGRDKGARGIHMRLLHMGILMNIKKIRRLMKKYQLVCPIRKANPYRQMMRAIQTSHRADNIVNRNFTQAGPRTILLTDITYIPDEEGFCYLSSVKDAVTRECLAHVLSRTMEEEFVLETIEQLMSKHGFSMNAKTLIHSDQGPHYTSVRFIDLLKDKKLRQSMSRRGNCWDNAPKESFFGHMKDELKIHRDMSFEEIQAEIDDWMDYYNNDRYQWSLAKLSPREFYEYLMTGKYPLAI
jgi:transposase InsO family protein